MYDLSGSYLEATDTRQRNYLPYESMTVFFSNADSSVSWTNRKKGSRSLGTEIADQFHRPTMKLIDPTRTRDIVNTS